MCIYLESVDINDIYDELYTFNRIIQSFRCSPMEIQQILISAPQRWRDYQPYDVYSRHKFVTMVTNICSFRNGTNNYVGDTVI